MVPFFGGRVKQYVKEDGPNRSLEYFTGQSYTGSSGEFYIEKKEHENFGDIKKEYTNGAPNYDYNMNRYSDSLRKQNNTLPFAQIKVGSGLKSKERYGNLGKDGYHSMYRPKQYNVNELRTLNNSKVSYSEPVSAPKHFVTNRGLVGDVSKNKVYRYFENKGLLGQIGVGDVMKTSNKEGYEAPMTRRENTSTYILGGVGTSEMMKTSNKEGYKAEMTGRESTSSYLTGGIGKTEGLSSHKLVMQDEMNETNRQYLSTDQINPAHQVESGNSTSYASYYNAELNSLKESTIKMRAPTKVSAKLASGKENVNAISNKLQFDINDKNREQIATNVYEMGTNRPRITSYGPEYNLLSRLDETNVEQLRKNPYSHGVNSAPPMTKH